jgi:small subunit ribosomal protein S20
MPNTKSAIRRTKKTKTQTIFNRVRKSKYKLAIKKMLNYISAGKTKDAKDFLPKFHSQLIKVSKTGVISKKTASRKISRITKKIKNLNK